jgi:hypothetical protein
MSVIRSRPEAKPPEVRVNIEPVNPADVTPAQVKRYSAAWARLIAKASEGQPE